MKWRSIDYQKRPVHYVIGDTDRCLADSLELIYGQFRNSGSPIPDSGPVMDRVLGSKLVFDPGAYHDDSAFRDIAGFVGSGAAVVLLRRTYFDWLKSWKARGVVHAIVTRHDASDRYFEGYGDACTVRAGGEVPRPRHLVLVREAGEGPHAAEGGSPAAAHYPMVEAIDDLLQAFCNDVHLLATLRRRSRFRLLDYRDIEPAFPGIAALVGSAASPDEAVAIMRDPSTRRLPDLPDDVFRPHHPLRAISDSLETCFARLAASRDGADAVWRWSDDRRSATLRVPGLPAILEDLGLARRKRWWKAMLGASDGLTWTVRKPVIRG